ncbi:hypothetical protein V8B97DRAFT_923672 [Scleroderma yunnanense]
MCGYVGTCRRHRPSGGLYYLLVCSNHIKQPQIQRPETQRCNHKATLSTLLLPGLHYWHGIKVPSQLRACDIDTTTSTMTTIPALSNFTLSTLAYLRPDYQLIYYLCPTLLHLLSSLPRCRPPSWQHLCSQRCCKTTPTTSVVVTISPYHHDNVDHHHSTHTRTMTSIATTATALNLVMMTTSNATYTTTMTLTLMTTGG